VGKKEEPSEWHAHFESLPTFNQELAIAESSKPKKKPRAARKKSKRITVKPAGIGVVRDMNTKSFGYPVLNKIMHQLNSSRQTMVEPKNTPQEQGEAVNNKQ
jgi:hypothetical protein